MFLYQQGSPLCFTFCQQQFQYLYFLIDPSFEGPDRLFISLFKNKDNRIVLTWYYLQKLEIKDYNVKIDGQNVVDQLVKTDMRTYNNIWKNGTGQGDYYTTGCFRDHPYFKEPYKLTAIDESKQQAVDAD